MTENKQGSLADVQEIVGVKPDYLKKELFAGLCRRRLGDHVGLTQIGINHTVLNPGAHSALRHWHEGEDEFIYVLSGEVSLIDDSGQRVLGAGSFAGFPCGSENGHHLVNASDQPASFLEVGTRRPGADKVHYPDDDFGPIQR